MPERLAAVADLLARALVAACEEHGLPNRFVFRELAWFYGGPPPLLAAQAARWYPDRLEAALEAAGWQHVRVRYAGRGAPIEVQGRAVSQGRVQDTPTGRYARSGEGLSSRPTEGVLPMRRRAVWKASTVQPKPGTPGYVFPVRPHPATPVAGYQWAFKPDGDDGAYYCGPGDFEIQGQERGGSHPCG